MKRKKLLGLLIFFLVQSEVASIQAQTPPGGQGGVTGASMGAVTTTGPAPYPRKIRKKKKAQENPAEKTGTTNDTADTSRAAGGDESRTRQESSKKATDQ